MSVSRLLYKGRRLNIADINIVIDYYSLIYPFIIIISTLLGIGHSAYKGGEENGCMGYLAAEMKFQLF